MTDTQKTRAEPQKYQYIDVMRGIAILLVVYCHTLIPQNIAPIFAIIASFGQLGVQLFFVASAVTLYLSMSSRGLARGELSRFYTRRWFRIAPLYYSGIAFYYLLNKLNFHSFLPLGYDYNLKSIASNIFLVHGFYKPGNNNIVPGGWSVGCEVIFYALFPLIFVYVTNKRRSLSFIVLTLILNIAVQIGINRLSHKPLHLVNDSFSYFLIFNQLPVFGCGILMYFLLQEQSQTGKPLQNLGLALLSVLLTIIFWFSDKIFGLAFAFVPLFAGFTFVFIGLYLSHIRLDNWIWRGIADIGRKSFSIYVFHFIFSWSISVTIGQWLKQKTGVNDYFIYCLSFVLTLFLTYVIAIFTQHYIEAIGVQIGKRILSKRNRL